MMKPIETRYNGYRFRSRTEARWAVFFDSLRIGYEYEPEGFEFFDSGERYLPDFVLPLFGVWVEVKGEPPDERAVRVACKLAKASGKAVLFAVGTPGYAVGLLCPVALPDGSLSLPDMTFDTDGQPNPIPVGGWAIWHCCLCSARLISHVAPEWKLLQCVSQGCDGHLVPLLRDRSAIAEARSARFADLRLQERW